MNLTITKDDLSCALQRVRGACGSRTLPILNCVLLRAEGDRLHITANNLDLQISHSVPARFSKESNAVLNLPSLANFVTQFGPQEIDLSISDKLKATLKSGAATCSLNATDPDEFPSLKTDPKTSFTIEQAKLKAALKRTANFVSVNDTRYALEGVNIEIKVGNFRATATNGRCLASYACEIQAEDVEATIPTRAVTELAKLLADEGECKVAIGVNMAEFTFGDTTLTTKLIDIPYPNWRQVVPAETKERITVQREELQSSVRLAASATPSGNNGICLKLALEKHTLKLDCQGESSASTSMAINYVGDKLTIGLNPDYLLDVLSVLPDDEVHLEFIHDLALILIKAENYLAVIMPKRIS